MPSPKAILCDIADRKLDPHTNYTKSSLDSSGRIKVKGVVAEAAPEKTVAVEKQQPKAEVSEKKSTKVESSTAKKSTTAPSHAKGKAPTGGTSVTEAPEGTSSVENSVEQDKPKAAEVSIEVGTADNS